ncbi:MAG: hypothetical protein JJT78_18630 [Leptospira sp.]|nr:hypothetical protein [Leptospira sp.]
MPIIHTALPAEGKIFKQKLGLKPIGNLRSISLFGEGNTLLVQSGVGKVSTATALSYASALFPKSTDYFLNVGIAGSCNRNYELGSPFLISKATDLATGRSYYPDLILKSPWALENLATVDKPYFGEALDGFGLVDMEGSSFFQTALYFTESHRIHSIKIVSDYLEGKLCKAEDVENWMEMSIAGILQWLEMHNDDPSPTEISHPNYDSILEEIMENLLLTKTQGFELQKAIDTYCKRKQILPELYKKFLYNRDDIRDKEKGKLKFKSLLTYLYNE